MTKRDYHPAPFRKMVALGESTAAGGWSSSRDRCWVSVLAAMISDFQDEPVECINAGIGTNLITRRSPGYDYSGKPAADERLEKHVFAHGPDLVLVSYGLNDTRAGTPLGLFVDVLAANRHTDWMVHYDGVHANDLGHRIIANRIFEVLAQNCSGLARRTKALEEAIPRWRDESTLKADYGYVRCDGKDYHRSQLADDLPGSGDAA
jgi:lysophospholipase L1-like esterase